MIVQGPGDPFPANRSCERPLAIGNFSPVIGSPRIVVRGPCAIVLTDLRNRR